MGTRRSELTLDEIEQIKATSELGQSLHRAARRTPDQRAKLQTLQKSQGLPLDTIERNLPEVDARHNYGHLDAVEITRTHPKTAAYLQHGPNAEVSIDDVELLQEIEDTTEDIGFVSNTVRALGSRFAEVTGNLIQFGGTLADDYRKSSLPDPGITIGDDGISWYWNLPSNVPSVLTVGGAELSEGKAARLGYKPRFTWEAFKGDMTATNLAGYVIEQGVKSVPDMVASMYVLPAYIASRTEEIAEARAKNKGRGVSTEELVESLPVAVLVSVLERIGAKSVFGMGSVKSAKDVAKAAGIATVKEAGTEFVQEGVEYYGETVGTRKKIDHLDALDRAIAGAVAGGPMGGVVRGTTATTEALAHRVRRNAVQLGKSDLEQTQLESLLTLSQSSTTRERAIDQFREFLQSTNRSVFVTTESLTELDVVLPESIRTQMTDINGDVEISVDILATDMLQDPDLMTAIRPHLRFTEDSMSQSEIDAGMMESTRSLVEKEVSRRGEITEADKIFETVRDQLVATGRQGKDTAAQSAAIIPAVATSMAEERGISVTEAYETMGFEIVSQRVKPTKLNQEVTRDITDDDGNVIGTATIKRSHLDKQMSMMDKLTQCLRS